MSEDPVAAKSSFLKMYMSSHPDTLVAYCKFYGKVKEAISSAEMSHIECKSMTLGYTTKDGKKDSVVIPIQPPLRGYEDVKPRLLEMKAKAQEGLGMIKAPQITSYQFPLKEASQISVAMLWLVYCTIGTGPNPPATPVPGFWEPGRAVVGLLGGRIAVTLAWWTVGVFHSLEALYTASLCRKHTGFVVGSLYTMTTLVFGFPGFVSLRKRIQAARIDSVMKIE